MIFPEREEIIGSIIYCPICKKHYWSPPSNISCAVNHPPGTCCHYTDKEITEEQVKNVKKMLEEK